MDLKYMIKAHSDYSQSYPGHNKGCKICFILAEVKRLGVELKKVETYKTKVCKDFAESISSEHKLREASEWVANFSSLPSQQVAKEALKDSEPEPERWGCCGEERNEIHGQYCPRCS